MNKTLLRKHFPINREKVYDIAYDEAIEKIKSWDWDGIKADAINNVEADMDGDSYGSSFLGTCFNLTPSGKYYMPWACSNVTEKEAIQDEAWQDALEEIATLHGMFVQSGEGDPCDIFACVSVESEDSEDE